MPDELPPKQGEIEVSNVAAAEFEAMFNWQRIKGFKKYGTHLRTFNGRNAYHDFMQELVDALMYATQLNMELQQAKADLRFMVEAEQVRSNNDVDDSRVDGIEAIKQRWGLDKCKTEQEETCNTSHLITDGYGNYWDAVCPHCGQRTMQVVRPGKVQCGNCD